MKAVVPLQRDADAVSEVFCGLPRNPIWGLILQAHGADKRWAHNLLTERMSTSSFEINFGG